MGRTGRRRRAKEKDRRFQTCNHHAEVILLNSWLTNEKCERNSKLLLASFEETGRGVLTKKKIYSGEELIRLPLNLTINITTILIDQVFSDIFSKNTLDITILYKRSISFQSCLALYLIYLKSHETKSKWYIYLETLPKCYTVPYYLPNEIKPYLSKDVLSVVTKQNNVIESSFKIFKHILASAPAIEATSKLKEMFTRSEYEWAYFTVNTRCVFMDLSKVINFQSLNNSILEMLNDNTNIALCPFLDMINHSANARNETKLILNRNSKDIEMKSLNEHTLSDVQFTLYTKNNIDAYKEVFICYGDSHNLKLITEYGFFLPDNNLDSVLFNFDTVHNYLKSCDIKLSQDQLTFINNHGLCKDLYIDCKGLSFNFYALLMVIKCYYKQSTDVSRIIYSSEHNIGSDNSTLNDLIIPLVKENVNIINNQISDLEKFGYKCSILDNCMALMQQYVKILERFIKC